VVGGVCGVALQVRRAPTICFADGNVTFNYWSWELNANYNVTEDIMFYGRAGKGQKAGGFNSITNEALLNPFGPEIAKDLEAGIKAQWLNDQLRTNLAAYRTKYNGIQRNRVVPGPAGPVTRIDNAASATIKGLEAELIARPTSNFDMAASFAYTDTKYKSFVLSGADVSANKFPFVPKYTYSLSANYEQPLNEFGSLSLHADWSYRDDVEFVVINRAPLRQSAYGILSARATLDFTDQPGLRVAVFGTNLLKKKYNVGAVEVGLGYDVLYRGEPRIVGVEVTKTFGGGV
jgi:iron complex outermembrane receptor protein